MRFDWHSQGLDKRYVFSCYVVRVVDSYVASILFLAWSPTSSSGISRDFFTLSLFNYKVSNADTIFYGVQMNVSGKQGARKVNIMQPEDIEYSSSRYA